MLKLKYKRLEFYVPCSSQQKQMIRLTSIAFIVSEHNMISIAIQTAKRRLDLGHVYLQII